MFTKLLTAINSEDNLPAKERETFFEAVANASESEIENNVGRKAKNAIMQWWYDVCTLHLHETERNQ